jgi:DNA invertase Pin-like site-specific DNA recombinase
LDINIGYARTSTADQLAGFEAQIKELEGAGCKKIYSEQVTGVNYNYPLTTTIITHCRIA